MIKLKQLIKEYEGESFDSETPKTNAEASDGWSGNAWAVSYEFAQKLERELNLLKARGDTLAEAARRVVLTGEGDDIHKLSIALDEYKKK